VRDVSRQIAFFAAFGLAFCCPAAASTKAEVKDAKSQVAKAGAGNGAVVAIHKANKPAPTASELREIRDLKAQEEMAKWAFWMLIAAVSGALLTILGLGFIWRTLHHTRRAADFAGEAVNEGRNAAANQLRAYVGPRAVNYTFDPVSGGFGASAEISNFGQTPAFKFRHISSLNYLPFPLKDLPDIGLPTEAPHTLYPTQNTYINTSLPMRQDRVDALRTATGCFLLSFIIEYFDHQGVRHLRCHRFYTTNNLGMAVWVSTYTGTMTFHSDFEMAST
jgi:hypothetical protein